MPTKHHAHYRKGLACRPVEAWQNDKATGVTIGWLRYRYHPDEHATDVWVIIHDPYEGIWRAMAESDVTDTEDHYIELARGTREHCAKAASRYLHDLLFAFGDRAQPTVTMRDMSGLSQ